MEHVLSDVLMQVHEGVVVEDGPHASLETCINTHIKRLQLVGGVRGQGQNDNSVVTGIFNGLNIHVTLSTVHNNEDLVCR